MEGKRFLLCLLLAAVYVIPVQSEDHGKHLTCYQCEFVMGMGPDMCSMPQNYTMCKEGEVCGMITSKTGEKHQEMVTYIKRGCMPPQPIGCNPGGCLKQCAYDMCNDWGAHTMTAAGVQFSSLPALLFGALLFVTRVIAL